MYLREDHGFGSAGGGARSAALPSSDRRARRLGDVDLVVDLGSRIGSPEWFRGLATLGAMIAALIHVAPGVRPLAIPRATHSIGPQPGHIRQAAVSRRRPSRALATSAPETKAAPSDDMPVRLTGVVGETLYGAERAAGAPPSTVAEYIRAVAPRVDIGEIAPFDRFDMIFERRRQADGSVGAGRLLYAGIIHDGTPLGLMRWTLAGREQWLDTSGAGARHGGFTMPVTGAQLSSGFGMRLHPILGFSRMHQGVDLSAPLGTPIVAASAGVVRFAGWHGGLGNFVQIAHEGGLGTGYGHMSAIVVQPGDSVQQGELIGYVGSTGLSTGPHCHFEVYQDGVAVDPATARFETVERLGGASLTRFRSRLARLEALAAG